MNPAADLSITKSGSPDPVPVGQLLTYTLTAENDGPSSAPGVQVTDTLSPDVTFESASSSQGTCSHASGTVNCALGTIASGGSATVTIEVRPQSSGSLTNQATIGSTVTDPSPANNVASAETTVDPAAGLSLSKDDSPDPVLVGQLLTYTLTAHNSGPLSATGVQLADTLPAGVIFDSATSSQGTCGHSSGTVSCSLGTLAAAQNVTIEIKVRPQATGSITNQATLTSPTFDPDPSDNVAGSDTVVDPAADLFLQQFDSPDPVPAGQPITYTLTTYNAGPSSATGVQITDTLPAGVEFESATSSQGSCTENAGTVSCALGTLAPGAEETVDIDVVRNATGSITNEASVASEVADPNLANNAASAETTITPAADLALTKTGEPDPVLAGLQLTYTLEVVNTGPQNATGVQLTDTLPPDVTYDSATPSQGTCSQSSGTVTCGLGSIASGQIATVEIKIRPHATGSIGNQASVTSDVADPDTQNNSASVFTAVDSAADLSLTKSDSPDPVPVGGLLTYTLTAHNAGPSTATGVNVTDDLPAGVTFDSATTSQGSCSQASGTVTCPLGTLASGANATVTIRVRPQSAGSITNTASVSSDIFEPNPSDNSTSAETTVNPAADLAVTKADSPDPVPAGELLTYSLTIHNSGPSGATGVQLTDDLPAGVTYSSATPSQGSCSEAAGTVSCPLGTIASGQGATVDIKVRPQSEGSITNNASVSSDVFDPATSDNSTSAATTVSPAADLSLTKSDSPDPVPAGDLLTYTLTVDNDGPSGATNVQLLDNLPAGVTFESATPSQGDCLELGATVSCALGTIAAGQSATRRDRGAPPGRGLDHEQREHLLGRIRPECREQHRRRRHHRDSCRRPRALEVGLAGPGGRRAAAHLHTHGPEFRAVLPPRAWSSRTTCRPASRSNRRRPRRAAARSRAAP